MAILNLFSFELNSLTDKQIAILYPTNCNLLNAKKNNFDQMSYTGEQQAKH